MKPAAQIYTKISRFQLSESWCEIKLAALKNGVIEMIDIRHKPVFSVLGPKHAVLPILL